jgi:hypothetical protein
MSKFGGLALAVDKMHRLKLVHPATRKPLVDKDGEQAYIDHYSIESDAGRRYKRSVTDSRLEMTSADKLTAAQLETEKVEYLANLTAGWYLLALDGSPLGVPFTIENARELYAEPGAAWIAEALDKSASDRGNFAQASSQA